MAAGAIYDAAFGVSILAVPTLAAGWLGLEVPTDRTYLGLNGVLLLLLAGVYSLPARWPERYAGVIAVAAAGRVLGFVYLSWVWLRGNASAFGVLALVDLAFGLVHAALLARCRRLERRVSP